MGIITAPIRSTYFYMLTSVSATADFSDKLLFCLLKIPISKSSLHYLPICSILMFQIRGTCSLWACRLDNIQLYNCPLSSCDLFFDFERRNERKESPVINMHSHLHHHMLHGSYCWSEVLQGSPYSFPCFGSISLTSETQKHDTGIKE